jgi:hypothetical protein
MAAFIELFFDINELSGKIKIFSPAAVNSRRVFLSAYTAEGNSGW